MVKGYIANFGMFLDFLSICVLDDFFRFSKKSGFGIFLVQTTVVSVLLSASVKRCFVSRMRNFYQLLWRRRRKNYYHRETFNGYLFYNKKSWDIIFRQFTFLAHLFYTVQISIRIFFFGWDKSFGTHSPNLPWAEELGQPAAWIQFIASLRREHLRRGVGGL